MNHGKKYGHRKKNSNFNIDAFTEDSVKAYYEAAHKIQKDYDKMLRESELNYNRLREELYSAMLKEKALAQMELVLKED